MSLPQADNTRSDGRFLRNFGLLVCLSIGTLLLTSAFVRPRAPTETRSSSGKADHALDQIVQDLDESFRNDWVRFGLQPAGKAEDLLIARRISLALTGTIPSLQEIEALLRLPGEDRTEWWLTHLFNDKRYADYVAERLTRTYVGTESGPFLVYRRRRLKEWLSGQIEENIRYDQLARSLIDSKGIWTSNPEVNFVTVSIDQNNDKKGPDEIKLAARLTRAFLGVRIDCMQCHDDKFGDRWKQEDFHQLASFFSQAEMSFKGVRDNEKVSYQYRFKGEKEERTVPSAVPFLPELLPAEGTARSRLAGWVTHPENKAFARTTVNRIWALMFNQPMISPIDDIPLDGPFPPGMEILAEDLVKNGYNLQRLIRIIASSRVFQMSSRSDDPGTPVTSLQEERHAVFPLSRLRPEQVAGSVIQASSLTPIDSGSHVLSRISSLTQTGSFLKRYGDLGEDEFGDATGTIPQRLLLMNGELVRKRTENNMVGNASTRIGALATSDEKAVELAYLTLLSRYPSTTESEHFVPLLDGLKGEERGKAMQDICWALINSTEFSWNH